MKRKLLAGGFAALMILASQTTAEPAESEESSVWDQVVDWASALLDEVEPLVDEIGPYIDPN